MSTRAPRPAAPGPAAPAHPARGRAPPRDRARPRPPPPLRALMLALGHRRRRAGCSTGSPPGRCWRRPGVVGAAATTAPTAPSWSRAVDERRRRGHDPRPGDRGRARRPPSASPGSRRCPSPRDWPRGLAVHVTEARPAAVAVLRATRPCWSAPQGRVLGPARGDPGRRLAAPARWRPPPAGAAASPRAPRAALGPDRRVRPRGGGRGSARCASDADGQLVGPPDRRARSCAWAPGERMAAKAQALAWCSPTSRRGGARRRRTYIDLTRPRAAGRSGAAGGLDAIDMRSRVQGTCREKSRLTHEMCLTGHVGRN